MLGLGSRPSGASGSGVSGALEVVSPWCGPHVLGGGTGGGESAQPSPLSLQPSGGDGGAQRVVSEGGREGSGRGRLTAISVGRNGPAVGRNSGGGGGGVGGVGGVGGRKGGQ